MNALWFATRATGIIAMLLLTAVTVLGIVSAGGWGASRWPRMVNAGMHRSLSLLTVAFLVLHIATTIIDGYVPIDWVDVVVPFATPYKTLWIGLGAVAVDLLLALIVTSLLRVRLRPRVWRGIHWLAYACWAAATVHALGAGTDRALTFVVAIAGMVLVGGAAVARVAVPAGPGAPAVRRSPVPDTASLDRDARSEVPA